MSSKAKRMEDEVATTEAELIRDMVLQLETTLAGSVVTTIGILSGKTQEEIYKDFKDLRNAPIPEAVNTVEALVEYVYKTYGTCDRKLLADVVLVTDDNNMYTPLVTFIKESPSGNVLMPLSPDGVSLGVIALARDGRDNISVEYIFNEQGLPFEGYYAAE